MTDTGNMRYYTYVQPKDEDGTPEYITLSENDIRKDWYPHWYKCMCDKYEQAYVDEHYSFEDCLDDFRIVYHATEFTK